MAKQLPLHECHLRLGAKLVEFAGWQMPVAYRGIVEEHRHTRQAASVFDISHMGRLAVTGAGAEPFLARMLTRDVTRQPEGKSRYALVCNEAGGVLDDVIVSREKDGFTLVVNAASREKVLGWFAQQHTGPDCTVVDRTEQTAMLAIQGPRAAEALDLALPFSRPELRYYEFARGRYEDIEYMLCRSGYTGEDGFEIVVPSKQARCVWDWLVKDDPGAVVRPAGLGSRDTLRLEAGMPLYGHELTEQVDPISAGLAWAVDLDHEFIGRQAIAAVAKEGPVRRRVGLDVEGRRIAREGSAVLINGGRIGRVTSGTLSPTLNRSIAMAYVAAEQAAEGTNVAVDIRGRRVPGRIVSLPFYTRRA